jgi:hypothetical protein
VELNCRQAAAELRSVFALCTACWQRSPCVLRVRHIEAAGDLRRSVAASNRVRDCRCYFEAGALAEQRGCLGV